MLQNVGINLAKNTGLNYKSAQSGSTSTLTAENNSKNNLSIPFNPASLALNLNTTLSKTDSEKYTFLLNNLKNAPLSKNAEGLTPSRQLDVLLKNGKLLAKSHDDKSTTLDNLYEMMSTERTEGITSQKVVCDTLDLLVNPRYVTQNFGDIPNGEVPNILQKQDKNSDVVKNPKLMNVTASGVCPAASLEVNAADKYPADFTRWINKLSSKNKDLELNLRLSAICKDGLEATKIINILKANKVQFGFDKTKIKIDLDDNAYIRSAIQAKYWDEGERNVADVLFQSAVMRLGSQNTYNSLTDWRAPNFNSNTQGLVEAEKTFVESIFKNKEITSLVYQQIDDDQNLIGYTCDFDKMKNHIINTIDSGDDVIIGYVLTNETAGRTKASDYNQEVEGGKDKVINGHEITIIDYVKGENGNIDFVCVDTDDDNHDFVIYPSGWLLPKIHHAGYPAKIVEKDQAEILSKIA